MTLRDNSRLHCPSHLEALVDVAGTFWHTGRRPCLATHISGQQQNIVPMPFCFKRVGAFHVLISHLSYSCFVPMASFSGTFGVQRGWLALPCEDHGDRSWVLEFLGTKTKADQTHRGNWHKSMCILLLYDLLCMLPSNRCFLMFLCFFYPVICC